MSLLQAIPCPRPHSPLAGVVLCYGCNEYYNAGSRIGYWCPRCIDAVTAVHAKVSAG